MFKIFLLFENFGIFLDFVFLWIFRIFLDLFDFFYGYLRFFCIFDFLCIF